MKNKKTVYIWILIFLEIILINSTLSTFLNNSFPDVLSLRYLTITINSIGLIISVIWLYQALMMKKDLIRWSNINFGFFILSMIASATGAYLVYGNTVAVAILVKGLIFMIALASIVWITFIKHLRKAISSNRIQLN